MSLAKNRRFKSESLDLMCRSNFTFLTSEHHYYSSLMVINYDIHNIKMKSKIGRGFATKTTRRARFDPFMVTFIYT